MGKNLNINNVKLSYHNLNERASYDGKEGKFDAILLIKKGSNNESIIKNIVKMESDNQKELPDSRICFKDGDLKETSEGVPYSEYADCYYMKCSNMNPVMAVSRDKLKLDNFDDFQKGCIVNANVDIFYYKKRGGYVLCKLNALQIVTLGDEERDKNILDSFKCEDNDSEVPF